jgi:hypothetical protein
MQFIAITSALDPFWEFERQEMPKMTTTAALPCPLGDCLGGHLLLSS